MTKAFRLLASASVLASAAYAAGPAMAAGTLAGTTITNNVTIDYRVGGVDQTQVTASDSFTVDRKINLTVAEAGTTTTTVSPGETGAITTFTVTNDSNATLDFNLAVSQLSGGTAAHGGTDNYDVSAVTMYLDNPVTGTVGSYDAGDTLVTYIDELPADTSRTIFVRASTALGQATGDVAGVRLTATAREGAGAGSLGAALTETVGANTAGVDTVFADTNANSNVARDAIHFAEDDYTVSAADLSAAKTSTIISDPLNGTTDPKMIPGSTIEYCIAVTNAGAATATTVAVSDNLPSTLTYDSTFGIRVNGTTTGAVCNADGVAGGSYVAGSPNVVSGSLSNLATNVTRTLVFRATVN